MNAANVSVTSADPEELANELAIATADQAQSPAELRVNGVSLVALMTDPAWTEPPRAWRLAAGDEQWTVIVHAGAEWQVLDIFGCVDRAEQVEGAGAPEVFIASVGSAWVVVHAKAGDDSELGLHIDANGVAIWQSRDAALATARHFVHGNLTPKAATA